MSTSFLEAARARAALLMPRLSAACQRLETNGRYTEQPLPGGPPDGPYAGAKWKRALCFRGAKREPRPRGRIARRDARRAGGAHRRGDDVVAEAAVLQEAS